MKRDTIVARSWQAARELVIHTRTHTHACTSGENFATSRTHTKHAGARAHVNTKRKESARSRLSLALSRSLHQPRCVPSSSSSPPPPCLQWRPPPQSLLRWTNAGKLNFSRELRVQNRPKPTRNDHFRFRSGPRGTQRAHKRDGNARTPFSRTDFSFAFATIARTPPFTVSRSYSMKECSAERHKIPLGKVEWAKKSERETEHDGLPVVGKREHGFDRATRTKDGE